MNVLVNFSTLKRGGGQNVALNFLHAFKNIHVNDISFIFLVARNSEIHGKLVEMGFDNRIILFNRNPIIRIMQEIFCLPGILNRLRVDLIYTYFGYAALPKKYVQVSGVAVSNVFYPEVDFWDTYKGVALLKRKIIKRYWLWGIKRANGLIFENESMRARSKDIFGIPFSKSVFIRPSCDLIGKSDFIKKDSYSPNYCLKILILSGWHRNKNIMLVPNIALELKRKNFKIKFIITAPLDNSIDHLDFKRASHELSVEDYIELIGNVPKAGLGMLYQSIDFVLLMSKLESFSNNIIESWIFQKPLLITNAEWAKAICGNSAVYINRESPIEIADSIINLSRSPDKITTLLQNSLLKLNEYPDSLAKAQQEIDFLRYIYERESTW